MAVFELDTSRAEDQWEPGEGLAAASEPAEELGLAGEPAVPFLVPFVEEDEREQLGSALSLAVRTRAVRDAVYRRGLGAADLTAALGAIAVALILGHERPVFGLLAAAPLIVLMSKVLGIYDREELLLRKSTLDEAPALFQLATFFSLIVWLIHGFLVTGTADRRILLVLWPALFFLLLTLRTVARWAARVSTPPERCLVIGEWQTSDWLEQTFSNRRRFHAGVVARVDSAQFGGTDPADGELLFEDLRELVSSLRVDRVVVTSGKADAESAITAIRLTSALGVKVSVLPRILEVVGSAVEFDDVDGLPLLSTHFARFSRSSQILKRAVDLSGSIGLLVLLSPLFLLIAVAVKLDSDGPVLFSQDRIGRQGRRFRMLKFRTMVAEADSQKAGLLHLNEARGLFKIANDPRCTRVGRLLRRASLDELPQLLNVVRNEMSLVGPRPLIADEDERVEGWHRRRLQLTPGMTGHWQILGSARIPLEDMLRIDYLYVTNWSLWLDVKILLRTIPYVLGGRGQ